MAKSKPKQPLSARAKKLLKRVQEGHWYEAFHKRTPKAMEELIEHGLVGICGRVHVVTACFVPKGFKAHKPERFPEGPKGRPRKRDRIIPVEEFQNEI